jgi:hypothetical protein
MNILRVLELEKTKLWSDVEQVIKTHFYQPDLQATRALYAAIKAHSFAGAPVWPMLVAPPGSMKTELLNALEGIEGVHLVDQVTAQTFISGQIQTGRGGRSPSLLSRIGDSGILVCADFSTVLGMKQEQRASILADLRRIYDGQLRKEFGTADDPQQHEWKGRITLAVAVTPAIDKYGAVIQALGDRFVVVRLPRAGGVEAALKAMEQDRKEVQRELGTAVKALFDSLKGKTEPQLPHSLQIRVGALAEIAVRGRSQVQRDGYDKEIVAIPEPESPTRLAQQLAQLAKGSAALDKRESVDDADLTLVRRVAFDCIQTIPRRVLEAAIAKNNIDKLDIPASTLHYAKENLALVSLLKRGALGSLHASPLLESLAQQAGIVST